jgi:uncharacterized membrane protein
VPRAFLNHPRAILLSAYALLAFALLGVTPLWLDELLQLGVGWDRSLRELLPWIEVNPGAVPLPYFVQQLSLKLFGDTAIAARIPAALFSVLGGCAFIAVSNRLALRRPVLALALFLFFPLQFRYALEARGYSQGLFFAVASLLVFLALEQAPSLHLACLYFFTIAVGLYFHPFLVFPVAAQLLTTTRRTVWIAAVLAGLCFVPWLIVQHQARQSYVYPALFPVGHVTPLVVLHELTGGGYVSTLSLLTLAGFGAVRAGMSASHHRLLLLTAIVSIAGPLLGDVLFHYFFAGRQFLIAVPALVLLAANGFDLLWKRSPWFAALPALVFLGVAAVKDFQDATVPKDDLAVSAQAVASRLRTDACVMTAPPWASDYYPFFRHDVAFRPCADPVQDREILVVVSPATSTPAEREDLLKHVPAGYARESVSTIGHSELSVYRPAETSK